MPVLDIVKDSRKIPLCKATEGRLEEKLTMTISDSFDPRTIANMEVALERGCVYLRNGNSERHEARRRIARAILKCARSGDRTLGGLTEAGRMAASELGSHKVA
jgi:hypothetical protein